MEATADELRRIGRAHQPLLLQVGLVERDDGRYVAGRGSRMLAQVEELLECLAPRPIGDVKHRMRAAEITRGDVLLVSVSLDVPQQQVHRRVADLHGLAIDLHADSAVILGGEERVYVTLHEARLTGAVDT